METDKILPELQAEKDALDPAFQHCLRLLERGESGPPPSELTSPRDEGGWRLSLTENKVQTNAAC